MANRLALGTVQFGLPYGIANRSGQTSADEASRILDHAWEAGMDTLDTAIAYGTSEQRLGEIGIEKWNTISKLPAVPAGCTDVSGWVRQSVQESLSRLGVGKLRGLLLHRPQQLMGEQGRELYRALLEVKEQGKAEKIGVSIYDVEELSAIWSMFPPDLVQAPFSILDRRLETSGWMDRLFQAGTEIHVRSIFLQGLLLIGLADRPKKFDRWAALWSQWDAWLEREGVTPLQACVRYALAYPQISRVVVGVDTVVQLEEILAAAAGPLPPLPDGFGTGDVVLLNPANWAALA